MDTHCRIASFTLKAEAYFKLALNAPRIWSPSPGNYYRHVSFRTWERMTVLQYVRAVR